MARESALFEVKLSGQCGQKKGTIAEIGGREALAAPVRDMAGQRRAEVRQGGMRPVCIERMVRIWQERGVLWDSFHPVLGRAARVILAKDDGVWDGNGTFVAQARGGDTHQTEQGGVLLRNSFPKRCASGAVAETYQGRGIGDECVQALHGKLHATLLKQVMVQSFSVQVRPHTQLPKG
ncbi:MAG: hypothetical protein VX228_06940 [Pseudomonadota bacterium]|nr:hypothetical protein [Pseudomonadota bacterium]